MYHLLKYGEGYEAQSAAEYEEQRRERELRQLQRRASKLGITLTPLVTANRSNPYDLRVSWHGGVGAQLWHDANL